jgi:Spy/CpxP family protein refolding chaperone
MSNKQGTTAGWALSTAILLSTAAFPAYPMDDMMPMGNAAAPMAPQPAPMAGSMPSDPAATSGGGGMGMMGCMECMSEMGGMGGAGGASGMGANAAAPNALPGFPGVSHLYHVGGDGFFLNHPQHIQLTTEQQFRLGRIREKAMLDRATAQRKIEEAEQQLYVLTAADQPDIRKIEAQARAIEELSVQRRLAYIRAVGEAAQVLTDDQRRAVLGTKP